MTVSLEKPAPAHGEGVAVPVEPNSRPVTPHEGEETARAAFWAAVTAGGGYVAATGYPVAAAVGVAGVWVAARLVRELVVRGRDGSCLRPVKIISVTGSVTGTPPRPGQEAA